MSKGNPEIFAIRFPPRRCEFLPHGAFFLVYIMAYQDGEYTEQPMWQSVLLFCCKGAIEGIIILLFIWLLLQILFTKHQEVHLQLLLGVGLVLFCLSLVLGCFLSWCWRKSPQPKDEEAPLSSPPAPGAQVNPALNSTPSDGTTPAEQQYEELDGDTLEQPPSLSCSSPSEGDSIDLPFLPRLRAASELNEHPKSVFPLRRLGTSVASLSSSAACGRSSLPSLPRLGLLSITRRVLEHRSTVTSDSLLQSEQSQPTSPFLSSPSTDSVFHPQALSEELYFRHYGSGCSTSEVVPQLNFSLLFSGPQRTLTVNVFSLSRVPQTSLSEISVHVSLPPLCPIPRKLLIQQYSWSQEAENQSFTLQVGSMEELQRCTLRMVVFARNSSCLREEPLGELELLCSEMDWGENRTIPCSKELGPSISRVKKSLSSADPSSPRLLDGSKKPVGQLYILLQYQAIAHRIKVMVQKAEHLDKLTPVAGPQDHYVVINIRHEGTVIDTKQTKGFDGHDAVWNTPFLFDLPPGDVTQLPLVLEFIVMQRRNYVNSSELGHVLIGRAAPEAGQAHWWDMCSREQVETARWHTIQPISP